MAADETTGAGDENTLLREGGGSGGVGSHDGRVSEELGAWVVGSSVCWLRLISKESRSHKYAQADHDTVSMVWHGRCLCRNFNHFSMSSARFLS